MSVSIAKHIAKMPPAPTPVALEAGKHDELAGAAALSANTTGLPPREGWTGIEAVLSINVVLFVVVLLAWAIWQVNRGGGARLFERREPLLARAARGGQDSDSEEEEAATEAGRVRAGGRASLWRSFRRFIATPHASDALVRISGLDSALVLRFEMELLWFMGVLSVLGLGILLPVNMMQGHTFDGHFSVTTVRNVDLTMNPSALWAHVVCTYLFSGVCAYFIHRLSAFSKSVRRAGSRSRITAHTVLVSNVPPDVTDEQLQRLLSGMYHKSFFRASVVKDQSALVAMEDARQAARSKLQRLRELERLEEEESVPIALRLCPGSPCLPQLSECACSACCRPPLEARCAALEEEIAELWEKEQAQLDVATAGTGRAFVIFRRQAAANDFMALLNKPLGNPVVPRALQRLAERLRLQSWAAQPAPEPGDISWKNMGRRSAIQWLRYGVVNIGVVLMLLLLTSPIAVLATLRSSSMIGVSDSVSLYVHQLLKGVGELNEDAADMLFAYLPTLTLVTINSILLYVMWFAGRLEPHSTAAAREVSILNKSFVYLLLNTLVLPSLAFGTVDALLGYIQDSGNVLNTLGSMFMRNSGVFFINYIIQRALLGGIIDLLRLTELFMAAWLGSRAVTREEKAVARKPYDYEFGEHYALMLSVFAVALVFSTMVPLILPVAAFYFLIKHYVDKYNFMFVYPRQSHFRGHVFRAALRCLPVCLLLYQAAMTGWLSSQGLESQFLLVFMLLVATAIATTRWLVAEYHADHVIPAVDRVLNDDELADQAELYINPNLYRSSIVASLGKRGKLARAAAPPPFEHDEDRDYGAPADFPALATSRATAADAADADGVDVGVVDVDVDDGLGVGV